ncbi:MAG TPA: PqqD family protein [Elusimicrobiota bacterium]|nr:PqqD family protein [Elusimicrobiota bacterium]
MTAVRYRHAGRLAQRKIAGTLFIVDPRHACLHQPHGSGETIWEMVRSGNTIPEMVEALCDDYDVEPARAEKDIRRFLRELRRKKLIEEIPR